MAGNSEDVALGELDAQHVLSIRATVEIARLAEAQGEHLHEVWRSVQRQELTPSGPPFVRYHTFGETETDVEVGVPVHRAAAGDERVAAGELPGGAAITTWQPRRTRRAA
jgi:hypothetical protein